MNVIYVQSTYHKKCTCKEKKEIDKKKCLLTSTRNLHTIKSADMSFTYNILKKKIHKNLEKFNFLFLFFELIMN